MPSGILLCSFLIQVLWVMSEDTLSVSTTGAKSVQLKTANTSQTEDFHVIEGNISSPPVVLESTVSCSGKFQSFCIHGICSFLEEENKPICRCDLDYYGERCERLTLNAYSLSTPEKYIAVGVGVGLLITGAFILFCCCIMKRKSDTPYLPGPLRKQLETA
ncbi:epigen [Protopterus annectens]|uniref:epigen n=1 Tax=Protopterus annectens TaxID=7888 RepID=UPI001CF98841|nr:epigen [Protopterus annectens]